jgi:hypothetical protein
MFHSPWVGTSFLLFGLSANLGQETKEEWHGDQMIVLPTGPGRCGSSTVARCLHEFCNINMGEQWVRQPDNFNPKGYYEDYAFGEILKNLMTTRVSSEEGIQQVRDMLTTVIEERSVKYTDWGFKANTLYAVLPMVMDLLPEQPYIIRCKRPIHKVVMSFVKTFRTPYRQSIFEILLREHMLDEMAKIYPMVDIHFDRHRTDEDILEELSYKIPIKYHI